MRLVYKPVIINKESIPKEGKIIIAGTHTNMKDCCLLAGCCTRRDIRFVAKRELLKPPFGFLFRMSGIIPVNRKIHDATVMPAVNKVLSEGGMVGIFPEGTINRTDDIIMPFKKGAVRMSLENNCKILPFAINGKYKRVTRIVNGEIMGHKDFTIRDLNDIIENYLFDGDILEIIY